MGGEEGEGEGEDGGGRGLRGWCLCTSKAFLKKARRRCEETRDVIKACRCREEKENVDAEEIREQWKRLK